MTHEEAVREWIARKYRARRDGLAPQVTRDDIRDVSFGVEPGWPGTDVTPGDDDFAVVQYEVHVGGVWKRHTFDVVSPALMVQECLEIMVEENVSPVETPQVDRALQHVLESHWAGRREPWGPTVTKAVFVSFLDDARLLAAEVRRLRVRLSQRGVSHRSR